MHLVSLLISAQEILRRGGRFTLSDDAHSMDQVGTNYENVLSFAKTVGVSSLACLKSGPGISLTSTSIDVNELTTHPFFLPRLVAPDI